MPEIPPQPLTGHLTEVALALQHTLAQDPARPDALVGMCLVALASGQPAAAVDMAQCAVRAAPEFGAAWIALGQALKTDGHFEDAEHAYLHALSLDTMSPLAHLGLGELKMAAHHPHEALREFDLALRRQPTWPAVHMALGHALACLNRNAEALERYKTALAFSPRLPEAEFAAAFVLAQLGRTQEAEIRYRRALALRPDFAAAWINLGCLLREEGREIPAEASLLRAVQLRPDLITGWLNLALLRRQQHRPADAEAHLRNAFTLDPENVNTHIAWCQFRAEEHDLSGAYGWLRWALAREPDNAEAVNMLGILMHAEDRFAAAVEAFRQAETLGSTSATSNRGNSLMELGRMHEALQAHQAAVERDPQNPGTAYNLALTQLRLGDWPRGWTTYEARLRFREVHRLPRTFRQPRWQGEPLNGRRILLHAEQGLGDAIQFCRYVPLVVARGGAVILQVHEPLLRLMQSLAVVRAGHAQVVQFGMDPPNFDLECPLMSLPAVFRTTVDTVPWSGPYLRADPESAIEKHRLFSENTAGLRVGIAWAGNPRYKADQRRSINLRTLVPLLRASPVTWISLQKGEPAAQLSALPADVHVLDGSSGDRDLADTAALISTLDLVITTDTCIAHLAGAMAKPTWILLPHLADWRWMENTVATPWYPTVRLFRQQTPGDWRGVINTVTLNWPRTATI